VESLSAELVTWPWHYRIGRRAPTVRAQGLRSPQTYDPVKAFFERLRLAVLVQTFPNVIATREGEHKEGSRQSKNRITCDLGGAKATVGEPYGVAFCQKLKELAFLSGQRPERLRDDCGRGGEFAYALRQHGWLSFDLEP
jgi:hypothetical protein